jgi:DNA repair protein RecO (recombination protein O)
MPRAERVFRTDAVILRRYDFLEADRLVTLFTQAHGKMRCIAKGVRKIKSRQLGHVELFTRATMLIAWGRELHVVSQSEMVESYLPLHEDLERGAYANYVAELVEAFSEFEEQNEALFALLTGAFQWLSDPQADLQLVARYFEQHLLTLVGFQPSLQHCALGQEPVEPRDQFFGIIEGGVICPAHLTQARTALPLSLTALKTMRYMQREPYDSVKKLKIRPPLHAELELLQQQYIVHILERKLRSVDFIKRLRRMEGSTSHPRPAPDDPVDVDSG